MQKKNSQKVAVLYGVLPLLLMTTCIIPVMFHSTNSIVANAPKMNNYPFLKWSPIIPVGVMTPETDGAIKDEYNVVCHILDGLNDDYGTHLSIYKKIGSSATESGLKYLLRYTERTHLSSHGQYDSTHKSGVKLHEGYIYSDDVNTWSLSSPKSDLLFLSACESLGHDDHQDNSLARAICTNSAVDMVIGYRDVVDSYSTIYIADLFWWYLIRAAEPYGGFSGEVSFTMAKNALQSHIDSIKGVIIGLSVVTAGALGEALVLYLAVEPFVAAIIAGLAIEAFNHLTIDQWIALQQNTHDAFAYYGVANVPELVWTGGGDPWGGDLPF